MTNLQKPETKAAGGMWHWPVALLLCAACLAAAQSIPEVDDSAEPEEEPWDWSRGRGLAESDREQLAMLVPVGHPHEGVRYPVYSSRKADGPRRRESELNAGQVERVVEDLLELDGVRFVSYGDAKEPEKVTRTVTMARAWYDLSCDFLFTAQPVEIVDEEHRIRSGSMLYDRASGLTIFDGGVEVHFTEEGTAATVKPNSTPAPGAAKP